MNKEQLNDILEKHKKWLEDEEDGERADLSDADLSGADLSHTDLSHTDLIGTDLRDADMRGTDLSYANMRGTDMRGTDMRGTNMRGANMKGADMTGTDLRGANLDYSCLPLWCGSLGANFDDRQLIQIAYHLVRAGVNSNNASDEAKKELSKLIEFANKFHRVEECGMIAVVENFEEE